MEYDLAKAKTEVAKLVKAFETDSEIKPVVSRFFRELEEIAERRDPSNYLLLPETDTHPELKTNLTRLSYAPEVQKIAEKLRLNLGNNSQGYVGNLTFKQAEQIAEGLEGIVETPSLFVEKLKILRSGKGYDANGNKQDTKKLENAFNELTEVRNPWRAQWLNHQYSLNKEDKLQVTYHKFVDGKIKPVTELLDLDTLMEDRLPGIDLIDYIENSTSQGLPRKSVKKGKTYFWHPRDGAVARFDAYADWSNLGCVRNPQYSGDAVGVAVAKIFHRK